MKKLFAIVIVTVLCLSFTACNLITVETYVEANHDSLVEQIESNIDESGLPCTADVRASENDLIYDIYLEDCNDLSQTEKDLYQDTLDSAKSTYDSLYDDIKESLPVLESVTWNFCEEDGDIIAVITTSGESE